MAVLLLVNWKLISILPTAKLFIFPKKGAKNIEVQITNVPKVKLIISKIYENNLLMAQRYGYYPQESSSLAMPVMTRTMKEIIMMKMEVVMRCWVM